MTKDKKQPRNSRICYGIGSINMTLSNIFITSFMTIFLTDCIGITGTVIGIMLVVARVWDAVNDPMMGMLADRTHTRWGKFRPYLVAAPLVMAFASIMLFSIPEIGSTWKVVWIYFFYILFGMSYTAYGIPYSSYACVISQNSQERTSFISCATIFNVVSSCVVSIGGLMAIQFFGGGAQGYRSVAILAAFIGLIAAWINAFKNKELPQYEQAEQAGQEAKPSIKESAAMIRENKPFLRMLVMNVVVVAAVNIPLSFLLYYLKYVIGDESPYIVIMAINLVIQFMMMALAPKILPKVGKKQTMRGALVIMLVSFCIYFAAYKSIPLFYVGSVIGAVGSGLFTVSLQVLTADTVDYAEWKQGKRTEGIVFSLTSFANKLATAICGGVAGFGLDLIGYVPNAVQSDSTVFGFRVLLTWVPLVLLTIALIVFWNYELDTPVLMEMEKALKARRVSESSSGDTGHPETPSHPEEEQGIGNLNPGVSS